MPILPDYAASMEGEDAGSGRLVYHTYTAEELARIPGLIASEEWTALLSQTRHQRAYWLAKQLGRPAIDRFNLLLHAPWGADNDGQRQAALKLLASDMPALLDEVGLDEGATYYFRYVVIDALRQLGRFDDAQAMLASVERSTPDEPLPPRPEDRFYKYDGAASRMAETLQQRVTDRFAISLLDNRTAARFCNDSQTYAAMLGPAAPGQCADRAALEQRHQAARDAADELSMDLPALDHSCSTTPIDDRNDALYLACDFREFELNSAEGERLEAEEPARVVELCQNRDVGRDAGGVFFACIRYDTALESVVGRILVRDDAAFSALCEPEPVAYEEDEEVSIACSSATDARAEIGAEELWQDLPALRKYCKESDLEERSLAQIHACVDTRFYDEDNPPSYYAREDRDGPLYYNELTRLIVPNAQALVAKWMDIRSQ